MACTAICTPRRTLGAAERAARLRILAVAFAATAVFAFAVGLTYPLLSLLLELRGVDKAIIGLNAAMSPLSILLFAPAIPPLVRRFGARDVLLGATLVAALFMPMFRLLDALPAWFVMRLALGAALAVLFILSETWVVRHAGHRHRGKIIAAYDIVLSLAFGAGPALVGMVGVHGWLPFLLGAALLMLGMMPLLLLRRGEGDISADDDDDDNGDGDGDADGAAHGLRAMARFVAREPVLSLSVVAFGIFDVSLIALLPVYGLNMGLDLRTASYSLSALIAGNVLLQMPIGWLADQMSKRLLLGILAALAMVALALLPLAMGTPWMWPVLMLAGAAGFGAYTLTLADLGDRYKGAALLRGTAAFGSLWGLGALLGSATSGALMGALGPHALPLYLALVFALLLTALIITLPRPTRP